MYIQSPQEYVFVQFVYDRLQVLSQSHTYQWKLTVPWWFFFDIFVIEDVFFFFFYRICYKDLKITYRGFLALT